MFVMNFTSYTLKTIVNDLRAARIMFDFIRTPPLIAAESRFSASGLPYDCYEPHDEPICTVIAIHGVVMAGEKDTRLVKFARAFAAHGVRVLIPSLDGLKNYEADPDDVQRIVRFVSDIHVQTRQKMGMIAFSLGAGLTLVAASNLEIATMIDPVILFGPYYHLPDIPRFLSEQIAREPVGAVERDNYIWSHMVLAYRNRDVLKFSEMELEALKTRLRDYLQLSAEVHEEYFRDVVLGWPLDKIRNIQLDHSVIENISPKGKLGNVQSRVIIIHDVNDGLIAPAQAKEIYKELATRGLPDGQHLLITSILSHVNFRLNHALPELIRMIHMIGKLF